MSTIALLIGLLLLSYVGSLIVGRTARGLPSGLEFLALGFAVGPHALGIVERTMIAEFAPIVQVGLGWLAFLVGLDFGRVEGRRVRARWMTLGISCAVVTGLVVGVATYQALVYLGVADVDRFVLSAGAGAVGAETTRFVVQWVASRWAVKGPVSDLLVDLAASDDFAPLVAAGLVFAVHASGEQGTFKLPALGWFALSILLGALLGTVTALLLRGAEGYAVWGALGGTLLLGVGTAMRFELCTIFVTFVMGIALAAVTPTRKALRRAAGQTERAVLYPTLLLAGARIDVAPVLETRAIVGVLVVALLARILGKIACGFFVRAVVPEAKPAGPALGIVLLSTGPISVSCAFVFALQFPGVVGDTLLVLAAASALLGELVSPLAVKNLLEQLGELAPASVRPSMIPPPPPPPPPVLPSPSSPPPPPDAAAGAG